MYSFNEEADKLRRSPTLSAWLMTSPNSETRSELPSERFPETCLVQYQIDGRKKTNHLSISWLAEPIHFWRRPLSSDQWKYNFQLVCQLLQRETPRNSCHWLKLRLCKERLSDCRSNLLYCKWPCFHRHEQRMNHRFVQRAKTFSPSFFENIRTRFLGRFIANECQWCFARPSRTFSLSKDEIKMRNRVDTARFYWSMQSVNLIRRRSFEGGRKKIATRRKRKKRLRTKSETLRQNKSLIHRKPSPNNSARKKRRRWFIRGQGLVGMSLTVDVRVTKHFEQLQSMLHKNGKDLIRSVFRQIDKYLSNDCESYSIDSDQRQRENSSKRQSKSASSHSVGESFARRNQLNNTSDKVDWNICLIIVWPSELSMNAFSIRWTVWFVDGDHWTVSRSDVLPVNFCEPRRLRVEYIP